MSERVREFDRKALFERGPVGEVVLGGGEGLEESLSQVKDLLGPLVNELLREEDGSLDLSKVPAKDFAEFKQFLSDQAGVGDGKSFRNPYRRLLLSGEYDSLLRLLFQQINSRQYVSLTSAEARAQVRDLQRKLIEIDGESFVRRYLSSRSGRERLAGLLSKDSGLGKEERCELVKGIHAAAEGLEMLSDAESYALTKGISTWNWWNLGVEDGDLEIATGAAEAILKSVGVYYREAEAIQAAPLSERSEYARLMTETGFEGIPQDRVREMEELAKEKSPGAGARSEAEAQLASLWLMAADDRIWQGCQVIRDKYSTVELAGDPRGELRAYILRRTEGLLKSARAMRTEGDFKRFQAELREFLHGPVFGKEDYKITRLRHQLVGASLKKMLMTLPSSQRGAFEELVQSSDAWEYSLKMGGRVLLDAPELKMRNEVRRTQILRMIQGLERAKHGLWYGYKQHKFISRVGSNMASWFHGGDIEDIKSAQRQLNGLIYRLTEAEREEELKGIAQELFESLKSGGELYRALEAAEMDGAEQFLGLVQTVAVMLAIASATKGLSLAIQGTGALGRVLSAARTLGAMDRMANGFKLGVQLTAAENALAVTSGEVREGEETIGSWGKDALATGGAMALTGGLEGGPGGATAKQVLKNAWRRYTANGAKGIGHLAVDTGMEIVEESLDQYARQAMEGKTSSLEKGQLEEIAAISAAGGALKLRTAREIAKGRGSGDINRENTVYNTERKAKKIAKALLDYASIYGDVEEAKLEAARNYLEGKSADLSLLRLPEDYHYKVRENGKNRAESLVPLGDGEIAPAGREEWRVVAVEGGRIVLEGERGETRIYLPALRETVSPLEAGDAVYLVPGVGGAATDSGEAKVSPEIKQRIRRLMERKGKTRAGDPATADGPIEAAVLLKLGDPDAWAFMGGWVQSPEAGIRFSAVKALEILGGARAIGLLRGLVQDEEQAVRVAVAESLGAIGGPDAKAPLLRLSQDPDCWVRVAAAEALARFKDPETFDLLWTMFHRDPAAPVRRRIISLLGGMPGNSSILPLFWEEMMADPSLHAPIAMGLGKSGKPEAVELLAVLAASDDCFVRRSVAEALGKIGGAQAIDLLRRMISDSSVPVVKSVAEALGKIGGPEALNLMRNLSQYANESVRYAVAAALGKIGGPAARSLLLPLAQDRDDHVRLAAAKALAKMGDPEGVAILGGLLTKPVWESAMQALGEIGGPRALELLRGLLPDSRPFAQSTLAHALCGMGSVEALEILETMKPESLDYGALLVFLDYAAQRERPSSLPEALPPSAMARLAKEIRLQVARFRDRLGTEGASLRGFHNGGRHRSRARNPRGADFAELRELKNGDSVAGRVRELNGVWYEERHHLQQGTRIAIAIEAGVMAVESAGDAVAAVAGTLAETSLPQGDSLTLLVGAGSHKSFLPPEAAKSTLSVIRAVKEHPSTIYAPVSRLMEDASLQRRLPPGSVLYMFGNFYLEENLEGLQRLLNGRRALGITVIPVQVGGWLRGTFHSVRAGSMIYGVNRSYSEGMALGQALRRTEEVKDFLRRNGGFTVRDQSVGPEAAIEDFLRQSQMAPGSRDHGVALKVRGLEVLSNGVTELPSNLPPRGTFERIDRIVRTEDFAGFQQLVYEAKRQGWGMVLDWVEHLAKLAWADLRDARITVFVDVKDQISKESSSLVRSEIAYEAGLRGEEIPPPEAWGFTDDALELIFHRYVREIREGSRARARGKSDPPVSNSRKPEVGPSEHLDPTTTAVNTPEQDGENRMLMRLESPLSGGSEYLILGLHGEWDPVHGRWSELPGWAAGDLSRGGGKRVIAKLNPEVAFQTVPTPLGGKALLRRGGRVLFELADGRVSEELDNIGVEALRRDEAIGGAYSALTRTVPLESMPPPIRRLVAEVRKRPVGEVIRRIQGFVVRHFKYHRYEGAKLEMFQWLQQRASRGTLVGPNEYLEFILQAGGGQCAELSELTVALLRLAGIPAMKADGFIAKGREVRGPGHALAVAVLPEQGGGIYLQPVETSVNYLAPEVVEEFQTEEEDGGAEADSREPDAEAAVEADFELPSSENALEPAPDGMQPTERSLPESTAVEREWRERWDRADSADRLELSKLWEYYVLCLMYRGLEFRGAPIEEVMLDNRQYARFTPSQARPPSYWMEVIRTLGLMPTPELLARFKRILAREPTHNPMK